jgi:hypothetical protein
MKRIIVGALVLASYYGLASGIALAAEAIPVAADEPDKALLSADVAFWTSIQASQKPEELQLYLQKFPNGMFADLARQRLGATTVAAPVDAGGTVDQPPVVVQPPVAPIVIAKPPLVRQPPAVEQVVEVPRKIVKPAIRKWRPRIAVQQDLGPVRVIRRVERYTPPPRKRIRIVRRRYVPEATGYQEPVYSPPAYSAPAYDFRLNRDGGGGGNGGGGGGSGGGGGGWH